MKSYKEGKYLVFEIEPERFVKYDLSDGTYIGLSGKKVKNLKDQLKGYNVFDVIKSFNDEVYKKYLFKIANTIMDDRITNTGTFLNLVRKHSNLEQFFTAGVENINPYITYKISEVPSGLINIVKSNRNIQLDNKLVESYKLNPDLFNNLIKIKTKRFDIDSIFNIFSYIDNNFNTTTCSMNKLINHYNYDYKTLIKYVDYLMYYEGIEYYSHILRELADYCKMCKEISRNGKFEKYPKHFLSTHAITVRNYNRLKKVYSEKAFLMRINDAMEFDYKDYVFIYPKSTQDIKDEAINLSHCVASYIQGIINGEHDIIFMRKADSPDESLITLEVINNKVTHSAGLLNRDPNKLECEAINKYNEFLGGK